MNVVLEGTHRHWQLPNLKLFAINAMRKLAEGLTGLLARRACDWYIRRKTEGRQHIEINDHGTIVILCPISDEGRSQFVGNSGDSEPGGIYICEPRMAQEILQPAARGLLSWQ